MCTAHICFIFFLKLAPSGPVVTLLADLEFLFYGKSEVELLESILAFLSVCEEIWLKIEDQKYNIFCKLFNFSELISRKESNVIITISILFSNWNGLQKITDCINLYPQLIGFEIKFPTTLSEFHHCKYFWRNDTRDQWRERRLRCASYPYPTLRARNTFSLSTTSNHNSLYR